MQRIVVKSSVKSAERNRKNMKIYTKAAQRWVVLPICRVSILMVSMYENTDELLNVRVYTFEIVERHLPLIWRTRGRVKLVVMKYHISLQAIRQLLLSTGLEEVPKSIIMIGLSERGKLQTVRLLQAYELVNGKTILYNHFLL